MEEFSACMFVYLSVSLSVIPEHTHCERTELDTLDQHNLIIYSKLVKQYIYNTKYS